jgi:hypothetical protein
MSRKMRRMAVALIVLSTTVAASVAVASASAVVIPYTFKNWAVWGSLTPKKLGEPVVLPKGSTFNGTSELTSTPTEFSGTVTGTIAVPPFQSTVKLVGLVPTTVGVTFTQVGPAQGTITNAPASDCVGSRFGGSCVDLSVDTKANIGITETGLLGIDVPTECVTAEPVTFQLSAALPLSELVDAGPSFAGTTTIPNISCGGLSGLVVGTLLSTLMSGPENPYVLHLGPNEPAPPTVVTQQATAVSQISADLHATVNPNGEPESECRFEYGTSTSYGTSVPCARQAESAFSVYTPVTGLEEGKTYHVRIVAKNPLGTSYGADQTFTTLAGSPEYGQCVAQKGGNYSDSGCQLVAEKKGQPDHKGAYEWLPGPSATCAAQKKGQYTDSSCTLKSAKAHKGTYEKQPGPGYTSSSGTVTLQIPALERTVNCQASTGAGEITGTSTGSERVTLSGCELAGKKCTSEGADSTPSGTPGVIASNLLHTRLLGPVAGVVWTELVSAQHEPYAAEFNCEGTLFRLKGSLSGLQSGDFNTESLTSTTTFAVEEGEQALSSEVSETAGKSWSEAEPTNVVGVQSNASAAGIEIRD